MRYPFLIRKMKDSSISRAGYGLPPRVKSSHRTMPKDQLDNEGTCDYIPVFNDKDDNRTLTHHFWWSRFCVSRIQWPSISQEQEPMREKEEWFEIIHATITDGLTINKVMNLHQISSCRCCHTCNNPWQGQNHIFSPHYHHPRVHSLWPNRDGCTKQNRTQVLDVHGRKDIDFPIQEYFVD